MTLTAEQSSNKTKYNECPCKGKGWMPEKKEGGAE